jgi:DNA-3-methyladenine glycosylase
MPERRGAVGGAVLPRRFFARGAAVVARALLGQRLVRVLPGGARVGGMIVEVEAYVGVEDAASHAFGGRRTPRNEAMYGRAGVAYVYFTYGMHYCFNVVCGGVGDPQAVLIRALEPTEGLPAMRSARRRGRGGPVKETELCSGPARLCQALRIGREFNGADLCGGSAVVVERSRPRGLDDEQVAVTPRIGVGYAGEWSSRPLRWFTAGCPHVSGR